MDMQQKPLATCGCRHWNAQGVLMYEYLIDFSNWTETVWNPRNGKTVVFKIDRWGNKIERISKW